MTNHTTRTLFTITACTQHTKCIVDKIYIMTSIISSNDFVRPILRLCNSAVSSAQCCMRFKTLMQKALVTAYIKVLFFFLRRDIPVVCRLQCRNKYVGPS